MGRVILSLYDNIDSACQAVNTLVAQGFRSSSIGLVAHKAAYQTNWGFGRSNALALMNQSCPVELPGIGPVLVLGYYLEALGLLQSGPLPLVRALELDLIPAAYAHVYTEGVRRRGVLVSVKAEKATSVKALHILDQCCPVDVDALAQEWRKTGWTRFDDTARPVANLGLNWPSSITALPGDIFVNSETHASWPQNIVPEWARQLPQQKN